MSELCGKPNRLDLLENAFRSFISVITTHILAGQVDAMDLHEEALMRRLWWFSRYFNPINLAWRYYSILAYRCMRGKLSQKQLALINFEAHPFDPPIPYVKGEKMEPYTVRRLEVAGIMSSQGLLSAMAAYQGLLAVQFTLSSSGFGFLPNVTKALAILGLFRVMVSPWIANKVHVEVGASSLSSDMVEVESGTSSAMAEEQQQIWRGQHKVLQKVLAGGWAIVLLCLVVLSMRSYIPYPPSSTVPTHLIDRTIEAFYNYVSISALGFHAVFLRHGACALANRNLLFDHWLYHLHTFFFLLSLFFTIVIGVLDFVQHDFYRNCLY